MGTARTVYVLSLSAVALWCSLILLAPATKILDFPPEISSALYGTFSHVCHQFPERSLTLDSEPLGVCARCTAIYFSFLLSLMVLPFLVGFRSDTPPRWVLIVSWIPMAVDVGLSLSGIHSSSLETRLLTGVFAGSVLPFFVLPPLMEAIRQVKIHYGDFFSAKQTR